MKGKLKGVLRVQINKLWTRIIFLELKRDFAPPVGVTGFIQSSVKLPQKKSAFFGLIIEFSLQEPNYW